MRLAGVLMVFVVSGALLAGCQQAKDPAPAVSASPSASVAPSTAAGDAAKPVVGNCWTSYTATYTGDKINELIVDELHPVADCGARHLTETFHVGAFPGDTLPADPEVQRVYAECEAKAAEFLGADWHDGRLALLLLPPTEARWDAGVRAFRCDLVERRGISDESSFRTGSLKDSMRGARPIGLGCGTVVYNTDPKRTPLWMQPAACGQPHNGEYIGTVRAPAGAATAPGTGEHLRQQCSQLVDRYTGRSFANLATQLGQQIGLLWWRVSDHNWDAGERSARCVLVVEQPIAKSLKA
ncbi:septum formation family protein [Dactylosporangium sp. NPDC005555]|uniref:septum formation family protein n=1 Tax=Dactylosporangium sp. NPDC005555 TaxID=3154889 RepID=UPI0033A609B9